MCFGNGDFGSVGGVGGVGGVGSVNLGKVGGGGGGEAAKAAPVSTSDTLNAPATIRTFDIVIAFLPNSSGNRANRPSGPNGNHHHTFTASTCAIKNGLQVFISLSGDAGAVKFPPKPNVKYSLMPAADGSRLLRGGKCRTATRLLV
jgi:hypothetical protein